MRQGPPREFRRDRGGGAASAAATAAAPADTVPAAVEPAAVERVAFAPTETEPAAVAPTEGAAVKGPGHERGRRGVRLEPPQHVDGQPNEEAEEADDVPLPVDDDDDRAQERDDAATGPARALTIGVLEEHHHALGYYERLRSQLGGGAPLARPLTILHLDSHADMGVPRPSGAGAKLESFAEINDFLTLTAYDGLADHLIFVEPPWSTQFRCCVYKESATFEFAVGLFKETGELFVDVSGETAKSFKREQFSHIFWRDGPRVRAQAELEHVKFFKVSVVAAELAPALLEAKIKEWIPEGTPWILDIDLDFWATISPGAENLVEGVLKVGGQEVGYDDLGVIYHLRHDLPDFGVDFFARAASALSGAAHSAAAFVAGVDARLGAVSGAREPALPHASALVDALRGFAGGLSRSLNAANLEAMVDFAADVTKDTSPPDLVDRATTDREQQHAAKADKARHRAFTAGQREDLAAFFEQPYHAPPRDALLRELAHSVDNVWAPILRGLSEPLMVDLVRSPGYVPTYALRDVECHVLAAVARIYKTHVISHEGRVDAKRTNCLRMPPFQYVQIKT
mmetsp:Transcript_15710/g.54807  ORF Transcript_15710/g.54807 Transcript_15710/m.54807 type:complete len:571 (+) Transcript_15710:413-2125(+)